MKIIVVQYPDSVDVSTLTVGQSAEVNTIAGGTVLVNANVHEAAPVLVPHTHTVSGTIDGIAQ